ncbi:hypothetical protein ACSW8Q_15995 (plasmid) [Clostridium perfringens]
MNNVLETKKFISDISIKLMNCSIDSLLGLNHSNETTNNLNNSDLSKKIFILNKLIEKIIKVLKN